MNKIFRMGHRTPAGGVITIASFIKDRKIFYGASYCSPKEARYDKQLGIDLASNRMDDNIKNNVSLDLIELKHSSVILCIIDDILVNGDYPQWAFQLLVDNLIYPVGLTRFNKSNSHKPINIENIIVDSEYTKQQLLKACEYLASVPGIDIDFMAISALLELPYRSEIIHIKQ